MTSSKPNNTVNIAPFGKPGTGRKSLWLRHRFGFPMKPRDYMAGVIDEGCYESAITMDGMEYKRVILEPIGGLDQYFGAIFLPRADIIMLIVDVTNKESFDWIEQMFHRIRKEISFGHPVLFVGVGTKIDLVKQRQVSKESAQEFFSNRLDRSIQYFETSSETGEGVNETFDNLVRLYIPFKNRIIAKRIGKDGFHSNEGGFVKQLNHLFPGRIDDNFWLYCVILICVTFFAVVIGIVKATNND